jgi:hypothetical protein
MYKIVCLIKAIDLQGPISAEFWADNEVLNAEEMHVQANPGISVLIITSYDLMF